MPLRKQQAVQDVGTGYIPPPQANPDVNDVRRAGARRAGPPAVRQVPLRDGVPIAPPHPAVQFMRHALGLLRARAADSAQERAERARQRAEEQARRQEHRPHEPPQAQPRRQPRAVPSTPVVAPVPATGIGWRRQMYVYTVLLLMGYAVWIADGAFTVIGATTTLIPPTVIGITVSIAAHFFISWGQHTLIFHPHLVIKGIGLVLLAVNAASNVYGITGATRVLRPALLGTLPDSPTDWVLGIARWVGGGLYRLISVDAPKVQAPEWMFTALIVLLLAIMLAWFAEKIRDYFHAQWKAMWDARPQ